MARARRATAASLAPSPAASKGTSSPTVSSSISATPPTSKAITGLAMAIDSMTDRGKGSA